MNQIKRVLCLAAAVLLLMGCTGCGAKKDPAITCLEDMWDRELSIGFPDDLDLKDEILAVCPKAILMPQSDILAIDSVAAGKLDCYAASRSYLDGYLEQHENSGLMILDEPLVEFHSGLGLSESAPVENFRERVNRCIAELKDSGMLADMEKRWFVEGNETMPEIEPPEDPAYTLRVVTYGLEKPNTYMVNNEVVGFDVELAYRVAAYLGCGIQIDIASFPAMLMGVAEGKYDMIASNLYITDERQENLMFSDSYITDALYIIVRTETGGGGGGFSVIAKSFRNTLVSESRWKMILSGLGVTAVVTVGGFLLANLLGALFCSFELSQRKGLRVLADVYSGIMQGLPIVVLLLLLYYVVFRRSAISGIAVAVLGFGLSSGATVAQLFSSGISAVDKGQKEAGLALGFTRAGTFLSITLPQAARFMLPGYFSALISMMKLTSVVGYISVVDLTKASDLIRSSTFEAFFPLISVAIIYFVISYLLLSLMKAFRKKLEPKRRTKTEGAA